MLCLWMVISLLQTIVEPEYYLAKPIWYIKTVIAIAGVYFLRENNMIIIAPLIGFVMWFLLSHKGIGKRILIVVGGVACSVILMTRVVYRTIEYDHADKSHETIRPLIAPVGSAIQQELFLPDDILESVEKSIFILSTYVLVIAWQMYFYICFFPLSVALLMIVSVVECGKPKRETILILDEATSVLDNDELM